jgi:hypothetical protein
MMDEITRFDLDMDGSMEPSEHGRWVRYEDAQRQSARSAWVGLTDEEINELRQQYGVTSDGRGIKEFTYVCDFVRAIEAKLREKNGGKS